jgi:predicted nucleotidyltransferase
MELISYSMDFASFVIQNLKDKENIKSIILFGSAAREEAEKDSDIDIFIDIINNKDKIEKEVKKIEDKFLDSVKFKNYWKLLGINNDLSIIVGRIEEWKLKDSMLGSSIILYQKYAPKLENGKSKAVLSWENINQNSRRVMLNKKIFGYNYYGKRYKGAIEKYLGKKLGTNVILVDIENINFFIKEFYKFKVPVKILRIFEYE